MVQNDIFSQIWENVRIFSENMLTILLFCDIILLFVGPKTAHESKRSLKSSFFLLLEIWSGLLCREARLDLRPEVWWENSRLCTFEQKQQEKQSKLPKVCMWKWQNLLDKCSPVWYNDNTGANKSTVNWKWRRSDSRSGVSPETLTGGNAECSLL